jgi:hypothetical protein
MDDVKIQVLDADGKYRGGLFRYGTGYEHHWSGAPKPNLQENMVCIRTIEEGEWFLLEIVLPREIVGKAEHDSLFDKKSACCYRTPVQALHWFMQQAFGPPPALVDRVRRFSAEWPSFCSSVSARALLQTLIERSLIDGDDPLFSGRAREDLLLLRRLELALVSSSSGKDGYSANSVAKDMGVDGYIAWMDGHLGRVSPLVQVSTVAKPREPAERPSRKTKSEPQSRAPAAERDVAALVLAKRWDEEGDAWTLTQLAHHLGCDRTQLTGKNEADGTGRCPLFRAYWQQRQREKRDRKANLKRSNRTRTSDGEDDHR